jgi:hypothetical protein
MNSPVDDAPMHAPRSLRTLISRATVWNQRTWASRRLLRAAFAFWVAAGLIVGAFLTAAHSYGLPRPTEPALQAGMKALREPGEDGTLVAHVLYQKCRCSRRILDHLVARKALPGITEKVVLVDADPEIVASLRGAGYQALPTTAAVLRDRYHVEAAPLLVVADGDGRLRYQGGYSGHAQGADLQDLQIIRAALAEAETRSLPLFGCAVSRELQRALDPLGIKYSD